MHAASAALLAFAFQFVTESAPADEVRTRGRHKARQSGTVMDFTGAPFGDPTIRAGPPRVLTVSSTFSEFSPPLGSNRRSGFVAYPCNPLLESARSPQPGGRHDDPLRRLHARHR